MSQRRRRKPATEPRTIPTTVPGAGPELIPEYVEGTMLGLTCRPYRIDARVLTIGGV